MGKKIAAWVVLLLVIIFPFPKAFLSSETPGMMMVVAFMITVIGVGIFYYLISSPKSDS
jgi:fatty-acid desaturase